MNVIIGNGNLVKKVRFPHEVLVISNAASSLVSLGIELTLLAVGLTVVGNWRLIFWLPVLLIVVSLLAIFSIGVGLALSALNVFFRDIGYLWSIVAQAWFYLTPIAYTAALLDGHPTLKAFSRFNPMAVFITAIRAVLYDLRSPTIGQFVYMVVVAGITLTAGLTIFARLSPRFAEEL